ncbi:MAG: hypothetical protein ABR936_11875 [Bacteroidota bacterium]|jgi:hypothetical protein
MPEQENNNNADESPKADSVRLSAVLGSAPDAIDNLKHDIGCYIAGHGNYPPVILMTQKQYAELLMTGKKLNLYTDILEKDRKIFGIHIAVENEPETMLDIRNQEGASA